MSADRARIKRIISTGVYKVLHGTNVSWDPLGDTKIEQTFKSVQAPSGWPDFFVEAVATSIQQELIMNGSYCDGLMDKLKTFHGQPRKSWKDLERWVKDNFRDAKAEF